MSLSHALLRASDEGHGQARPLARLLAERVLSEPVVALAREVLADGPSALAKARELAELVLSTTPRTP